MKKIAIIDCGTNTFHLLIGRLKSGRLDVLHDEKIMVQLGKGGISKNTISSDAIVRALSTLTHYKEIIDNHNIDAVYAFATSAFRNADNGQHLVDEIARKTGLKISVINGEREAELIYKGVKEALPIGDDPSLIVDIGGGSVECIIATDATCLWKHSFEIGAQRLVDRFHQIDPIPDKELEALFHYLDASTGILKEAMRTYNVQSLIGSSGTFDTLSAMHCALNNLDLPGTTVLPLPMDSFFSIYNTLKSSTRSERLKIPGMLPMRVDMIVVATSIIYYLIKTFNLKSIRVSTYAMKEGIFFEQYNSN